MITIDGGTGVILNNGVEVASEKMVDYWYLNADVTNSDNDSDIPGSKFTRNDKTGGASIHGHLRITYACRETGQAHVSTH